MTRRSKPTLFTEPDAFAVDTSSWFTVRSLPDSETVWRRIERLIKDKRLFTCPQVIAELRGDPIYRTHIKQFEKALLAHGIRATNPEFLLAAGVITHDYPAMSKARSERTPADPYIVALAQMQEYVMVADEGKKRINRKILGACQKLGIRCITISQLMQEAQDGETQEEKRG